MIITTTAGHVIDSLLTGAEPQGLVQFCALFAVCVPTSQTIHSIQQISSFGWNSIWIYVTASGVTRVGVTRGSTRECHPYFFL